MLTHIYVGNYSQWMPLNLTNEKPTLFRLMAWWLQATSYYQIYVAMAFWGHNQLNHYNDVIMGVMACQITSLTIVCSTVHLSADQRKHQSSASLAFVRGIHRWPVNSPHKRPVMRKMSPFDDVITCKNHLLCASLRASPMFSFSSSNCWRSSSCRSIRKWFLRSISNCQRGLTSLTLTNEISRLWTLIYEKKLSTMTVKNPSIL